VASSGRGAADISAAVAELDQEHARQHARSGERRRRGADRPANGGDVVQAAPSSGRVAADISAAVAELEEHAGEVDRGRSAATRCRPRRARGSRRARAAPRRSDISAAVAELDQEHAGEVDRGGDRRRRGGDRAELEVRAELGPRRGRHHQRRSGLPRALS